MKTKLFITLRQEIEIDEDDGLVDGPINLTNIEMIAREEYGTRKGLSRFITDILGDLPQGGLDTYRLEIAMDGYSLPLVEGTLSV